MIDLEHVSKEYKRADRWHWTISTSMWTTASSCFCWAIPAQANPPCSSCCCAKSCPVRQGDRAGQGCCQPAPPSGAVSAPSDGHYLSGFPADPHHDRVREHRLCHACDQRQEPGDPTVWSTCWSWCIWRIRPRPIRTPFPAANSSAWLWPVRCPRPQAGHCGRAHRQHRPGAEPGNDGAAGAGERNGHHRGGRHP